MKIIDPGHTYLLDHLDGDDQQELKFCKRLIVPGRTEAYEGTTCQEVIRALIDRVKTLNTEIPWKGNEDILMHLRLALVGFEMRAIERHVEKGKINPENIKVNSDDGHFVLTMDIK